MTNPTFSPSILSSPGQVTDWVKPARSDAVIRLRNSGLALTTLLVLTHLLPLPSPLRAAWIVLRNPENIATMTWALCVVEIAIIGMLALNVLQSFFALSSPKATAPPARTPAKLPASTPFSTPRRFSSSVSKSNSTNRTLNSSFSSSYAPSPLSTPSRTLTYAPPPKFGASSPSPLDTSASSSLSFSLPPTPSPGGGSSVQGSPLAAFRGRHSLGAGRPLNASFLSQLRNAAAEPETMEQ